ncbi:MAG: DUF2262 domain-containing protein [Oscillospiraceae bacterium]|nr:DUF2262 domain-containing protein [Oscillospiraceae bacterium]
MNMDYQDFREDDVFDMKGETTIWSERIIPVGLKLGDERGKREQVLRYIDAVNEQLEWIRQNRGVITDMLVKDGLLTLAEDWISGAEDISEYDENEEPIKELYRLMDGTEVALPLSEKEFRASLRMESISIDLTGGRENQTAELIMFCTPDYFAGHCFVLDIERDGTMTYRGLWG